MSNHNFRFCLVPGCKSNSGRNPEKGYHTIPKPLCMRKKWVKQLKCNFTKRKLPNFLTMDDDDRKNYFVCSDHFEGGAKTKDVKVPTIFPWNSDYALYDEFSDESIDGCIAKNSSPVNSKDSLNFSCSEIGTSFSSSGNVQEDFVKCEKETIKEPIAFEPQIEITVLKSEVENLNTYEEDYFDSNEIQCNASPFTIGKFKKIKRHHTVDKPENEVLDLTSIKKCSDPVFLCPHCNFTTPNNYSLWEHYRSHLEEKIYKCSKCSFETSDETLYKYHDAKHISEKYNSKEKVMFICPHCPYKTTNTDVLWTHYNSHTAKKETLLESKRSESPITSQYTCPACPFIAAQHSQLSDHLATHIVVNKEFFSCPKCPYRTVHEGRFQRHTKVHIGIV